MEAAEETRYIPTIEAFASEIIRLANALHAAQKHPDYDYSMTFEGNTAHTSREGWELNNAIGNGGRVTNVHSNYPTALYWRRLKAEQ
ncbi:hypothetical protein GTQ99_00635 [Kineococcus sp. T13]|uniref:hypothetical protein n=1 Tax=Kineococcus vitellinus TaxID=2696565 RepID=UPI001411D559|nr:hypothetical protein [Kineococcus vitellinus]NAZ73938.1 hypothetical protein [Kineococcus vitellinus]